jgi:hypothetical protein
VGSLIYLTTTKPDILFAVGILSKFMQKPCEGHWCVAKRVVRYLKGNEVPFLQSSFSFILSFLGSSSVLTIPFLQLFLVFFLDLNVLERSTVTTNPNSEQFSNRFFPITFLLNLSAISHKNPSKTRGVCQTNMHTPRVVTLHRVARIGISHSVAATSLRCCNNWDFTLCCSNWDLRT